MTKRRQRREPSHDADQICLWRAALSVRFLFSILCIADSLAQIARVRAVESLLNGFHERAMLRIVDDHAGPRNRLHAEPMTSNRTAKCKHKNRSPKCPHTCEAISSGVFVSMTRMFAEATSCAGTGLAMVIISPNQIEPRLRTIIRGVPIQGCLGTLDQKRAVSQGRPSDDGALLL